jgi:hypothetical protein
MATHPYVPDGRSPEAVRLDDDGRISKGAFSAYRLVRATMAAHGDTKPIWFTEFGWSTASQSLLYDQGVSTQLQADYLVRAYSCLEQDPYVEVASWFSLRDQTWQNEADAWAAQLGLMTTGSTRKPAYYAMRDYVPGTGGCTYEDPFAPADPEPEPDPDPADPQGTPEPTDPEPMPDADPASGDTGDTDEAKPSDKDGESATSSTVRSPAMLTVTRAQFRRGRLTIWGTVANGATGRMRGRAHFGRGLRRFTAPIDATTGTFRIDQRLRGARRNTPSVRVTLSYRGNRRTLDQTLNLTIRTTARSPTRIKR